MMNLNFKDKLNALNAFLTPSPFQDVVDQATSEYLLTPDWEKNIRIIDQMNHKTDNIKEVIRAIRRRTCHANPKVQYLALTLLEMGVKNCGHAFRNELCQHKELLNDIVTIASRKTRKSGEQESTEKALEIINTWNHAFRQRNRYPQLTALYHQAAGKGAVFDGLKVDDDVLLGDDPIVGRTPQQQSPRSAAPAAQGSLSAHIGELRPQQRATHRGPPPAGRGPPAGHGVQQEGHAEWETDAATQAAIHNAIMQQNQQQRVQVPERPPAEQLQQLIDEAHTCVELLSEFVKANENVPEVLATDELCTQVVVQTRRAQAQVVRAIESGLASSAEGMFEVLLELNDALIKNLQRYDELTAEIQQVLRAAGQPPAGPGRESQPQAAAPAAAPTAQKRADPLDELLGLDDLKLDGLDGKPPAAPAAATPAPAPAASSAPPPPPPPAATPAASEEDDFFAARTAAAAPPASPPPVQAASPAKITPLAPPPASSSAAGSSSPTPAAPPAAPAPAAPPAEPAAQGGDDDFDAFVGSRTAGASPPPPEAPAAPAALPKPDAPADVPRAGGDDDDFDSFLDSRLK